MRPSMSRGLGVSSGSPGAYWGIGVALFLNTFTNKVDRKGRVSVPSTFRNAVKNSDFQGIIIYALPGEAALEGSDISRFEALSEHIDTHFGPYSDEPNDIAMTVLAEAAELNFDPEGRVTLPQHLRDHAGIADQAVFAGMGKRFKILAPDTHAKQRQSVQGRARDALRSLPPLGAGKG